MPVSFVVTDYRHLNDNDIQYFNALSKMFVLIASNAKHPAFNIKEGDFHIIFPKESSQQKCTSKSQIRIRS